MATPARRRLLRDFRRLQQDPPPGVLGTPADDDIMQWQAIIFGYVTPRIASHMSFILTTINIVS